MGAIRLRCLEALGIQVKYYPDIHIPDFLSVQHHVTAAVRSSIYCDKIIHYLKPERTDPHAASFLLFNDSYSGRYIIEAGKEFMTERKSSIILS